MRTSSQPLVSKQGLALVLGATALLTGCRIQKPATEVPPPPSVDSFTASASQVAVGGKVSLTWTTSNATSIELREASKGELGVPETTVDGNAEATIDAASLFVLVARGPGGTDARAVSVTTDDVRGEVTFQALPPVIFGGASATLVWTAPGANAVSLGANGQAIDLGGQRTSGAVTVAPLFDTTYTLTIDGEAKTARVSVNPTILNAALSSRAAEVGDTVTLSWNAAGAERLVISSPGRGQLREITAAADIATGSFDDVVPPTPAAGLVTYEIAAIKGTDRVTRTLELGVGTGLDITRLEAPAVAAAGASYRVRWETNNADQVELKVDGVTVHVTATAQTAAVGLFAFNAPTSDFSVEVIATNRQGGRDSELLQVDAVGVPASATLTVDPPTVTLGQPVTLTFASAEARRVRITNTEGEVVFSVTGQPSEGGTATVYPTANTTYTLTADNQLGNPPVTATAAVTVTGTGTAVAQFPPTPISGQVVDLSTAASGALFYGFPHAQVLTSTQADFQDISSTGQLVLEAPNNVASITLPFSTLLWGTRMSGPLTVSRAGWMAWGATQVVRSSNATLPSTSGAPGMIAPFWDDLTLVSGTSGVYAQLVGNAPNETLIVQWNRMRVGTNASTEVTFQVQVSQRGTIAFQYQTMTLASGYSSFNIGVQNPTSQLGLSVGGTASDAPASNSARYYFSPVASPVSVRVLRGQSWGGYVKTGELFLPVVRDSNAVVLPQDLAVSELMFRPSDAVANGQYFEIINRTTRPLDLTGWEARAANTPTFSVPASFTVQPNAPTVIAASLDPVENDDAGAALAWGSSGFFLSRDAGTLVLGTADAGQSLSYSGPADGGRGVSTHIDPGPYVGPSGSPGTINCQATTPFGAQTPPQLGSPGQLSSCFEYVMQTIPVNFVDVTDGGARVFNAFVDTGTETVTITTSPTAPAPFMFGVRVPVVSISSDGWLVPRSTTVTTYGNDTNTSTSGTATGKLAIMWEDLETGPALTAPAVGPASDVYWRFIAAGTDPVTPDAHWIFQWHRFTYWLGGPDDMNFEIKLFENGVIEYHYGVMTSGSTSNYADGNSASIWLERPDGSAALAIGVNTAVIQPNTAYRFVPR